MKLRFLLFIFAFLPYSVFSQVIETDAVSIVLTDEGNDQLIERLCNANCTNLYQALIYIRNKMPSNAPAELTSQMDKLIDTLNSIAPNGEIWTASLTDFTGANTPVGINSDGSFIRADFTVFSYDGHEGYYRYSNANQFTYAIKPESFIDIGSNEFELGGGIIRIINYKAFALVWGDSTTNDVADIPTNNNILICPNPAKDYVEINFEDCNQKSEDISKIILCNPLGESLKIDCSIIDNRKMTIDISSLPVGSYYVKVANYIKSFVIMR